MNLDNIEARAFGDTHDIALKMLNDMSGGKVLDIAAGEGRLSYRLQQMGFTVNAADAQTSQFKIEGIPVTKADINKSLPYTDEVFDCIMCIETFEHVRNTGFCLGEFRRILKPDGRLILSTPNITSLISRAIFLFSGQYANFFNNDDSCVDRNGEDRHIMPLPSWLLARHLESSGFSVKDIKYSNGGLEIPTKKRPWKKLVFLPHTPLFGNSVIISARKTR